MSLEVLDPVQLNSLRTSFLDRGGLDRAGFVSQLFQVLNRADGQRAWEQVLEDYREGKPVGNATIGQLRRLLDMFEAIDVNHDGMIDWDEFSFFYLNSTCGQDHSGFRKKFRLVERSGFEANSPHTTAVTRLVFCPELQKVLACEAGCGTLKVYEPAVVKVDSGFPLMGEVSLDGTDALDVAFIPEHNLLAVAAADFSLKVYNATKLFPSHRRYKGIMAKTYEQLKRVQGYETMPSASNDSAEPSQSGTDELMSALAAQAEEEEEVLRRHQSVSEGGKGKILDLPLARVVHTPTIQNRVVWQPDGQQLLTSGLDERILVWTLRVEGEPTAPTAVFVVQAGVLLGHTDTVHDLIVIPSPPPPLSKHATGPHGELPVGEVLPPEEDDALTRIKGVAPTETAAAASRPESRMSTASIHVDPQEALVRFGYVVTVGGDCQTRVWRYANERLNLIRQHSLHEQTIHYARYVRLSRMLLTAGLDWFVQAYDMSLDEGSPMYRLVGHTAPIVGIDVVPSRAQAVTVDEMGFVRWWNVSRDASVLDEERCLQVIRPACASASPYVPRGLVLTHSLPAMAVRFMGDSWEGTTLVRIGYALGVGGMAAGEQLTEQMDALGSEHADKAAQRVAAKRAALPHGAAIVLGARWKAFEVVPHTNEAAIPLALHFLPLSATIVCTLERDLRLLESPTGRLDVFHPDIVRDDISVATVCREDRILATGLVSGEVVLLNLSTGRELSVAPPHRGDVSGVHFSDEDSLLITVGWDREIRVIDKIDVAEPTRDRVAPIAVDDDPPVAVRDEGVLVEAARRSEDDKYVLRSVQFAMPAPITASAFHEEQCVIVTGDSKGNLRVWSYERLHLRGRCLGHRGEITAVAFVPGYAAMVSADSTGAIALWNIRMANPLGCFSCIGAWTVTLRPGLRPSPSRPCRVSAIRPGQIDPRAEGVTSLSVWGDRSHTTLVAGTDSGKLVLWSIGRLVESACVRFDSVAAAMHRHRFEPRRRMHWKVTRDPDLVSVPVTFNPPEQVSTVEDLVQCKLYWESHAGGGVRTLRFLPPDQVLLSGGGRGEIKAWNMDLTTQPESFKPGQWGKILTSLSAPVVPLPGQWRFPLSMATLEERHSERVREFLQSVPASSPPRTSAWKLVASSTPTLTLEMAAQGRAKLVRNHQRRMHMRDLKHLLASSADPSSARDCKAARAGEIAGGDLASPEADRRKAVLVCANRQGRPGGDESESAIQRLARAGGVEGQVEDVSHQGLWSEDRMLQALSDRSPGDGPDDPLTKATLRSLLLREKADSKLDQWMTAPRHASTTRDRPVAASYRKVHAVFDLASSLKQSLNVSTAELGLVDVPGWDKASPGARYPHMQQQLLRAEARRQSIDPHRYIDVSSWKSDPLVKTRPRPKKFEPPLPKTVPPKVVAPRREIHRPVMVMASPIRTAKRPKRRQDTHLSGVRIEKHRALSVMDAKAIASQAVLQEEFNQALARDAARRATREARSKLLDTLMKNEPTKLAGSLGLTAGVDGVDGEGGDAASAAASAVEEKGGHRRFGRDGIAHRSGVKAMTKALIENDNDIAENTVAGNLRRRRQAVDRKRKLDPLEAMFAPEGQGAGKSAPPGHVLMMRKNFGPYSKLLVGAFRSVMQRVDRDGDHIISQAEFFSDPVIASDDIVGPQMEAVYRMLDKDGSGNVSVVEMARALFSAADAPTLRDILALTFWRPSVHEEQHVLRYKYKESTLEDLRRLFRLYDADGGGTIDTAELQAALRAIFASEAQRKSRNIYNSSDQGASRGLEIIESQLSEVIARVDGDGNQELDFAEFVALLGPTFEPDAPLVPDLDGSKKPQLNPPGGLDDDDDDGDDDDNKRPILTDDDIEAQKELVRAMGAMTTQKKKDDKVLDDDEEWLYDL
jgi:WD40 repeat protein